MRLMSEERRVELISKLFDTQYSCTVAPIYLDAIADVPSLKNTESIPFHDSELGVTHTVVNTNNEALMEALFSNVRYTGDEAIDKVRSKTPIDKSINIGQMGEIIAAGGTYTFNDPRVSTEIVDVINEYLIGIDNNDNYEVMYHKPPEEDMTTLRNLANLLGPLAKRILLIGQGIGEWADLDALFFNTGKFIVGGANDAFDNADLPDLKLDRPVDHRKKLPDPYSF